jgi:hypothetical protein
MDYTGDAMRAKWIRSMQHRGINFVISRFRVRVAVKVYAQYNNLMLFSQSREQILSDSPESGFYKRIATIQDFCHGTK